MVKIPIFPLNTVLFPGIPLNLFIFDHQYLSMMDHCINKRSPFGVLLDEHEASSLDPQWSAHLIGCTATVLHKHSLPDGGINLVAVGEKRFRLIDLDRSGQYLIGEVELLQNPQAEPETLEGLAVKLRGWIRRYDEMLRRVDLIQLAKVQLPEEPVMLAYMGAFILQIMPQQKQLLLEEQQADTLLKSCLAFYRRELSLLPSLSKSAKNSESQRYLN